MNIYAVYGLRARAYLVMHKWTEAYNDAKFVIDNAPFSPITISGAEYPLFNSLCQGNWIWGIAAHEDDPVVASHIVNFPSHISSFAYGYTSVGVYRKINIALYNSIPNSDVRKGWFLDADGKSNALTEMQQMYAEEQQIPPYANIKFAPYQDVSGQTINASDIPLMRIEEMYLIAAEGAAMSGNPIGIEILKNFVRTYRDPYYIFDGSLYDVQDEVWHQRRIELWGEGLSAFDIMRLKKPVDRRGGGFPWEWTFNIQPNDQILISPIPGSEIVANPKLEQNPIGLHPNPEFEY